MSLVSRLDTRPSEACCITCNCDWSCPFSDCKLCTWDWRAVSRAVSCWCRLSASTLRWLASVSNSCSWCSKDAIFFLDSLSSLFVAFSSCTTPSVAASDRCFKEVTSLVFTSTALLRSSTWLVEWSRSVANFSFWLWATFSSEQSLCISPVFSRASSFSTSVFCFCSSCRCLVMSLSWIRSCCNWWLALSNSFLRPSKSASLWTAACFNKDTWALLFSNCFEISSLCTVALSTSFLAQSRSDCRSLSFSVCCVSSAWLVRSCCLSSAVLCAIASTSAAFCLNSFSTSCFAVCSLSICCADTEVSADKFFSLDSKSDLSETAFERLSDSCWILTCSLSVSAMRSAFSDWRHWYWDWSSMLFCLSNSTVCCKSSLSLLTSSSELWTFTSFLLVSSTSECNCAVSVLANFNFSLRAARSALSLCSCWVCSSHVCWSAVCCMFRDSRLAAASSETPLLFSISLSVSNTSSLAFTAAWSSLRAFWSDLAWSSCSWSAALCSW